MSTAEWTEQRQSWNGTPPLVRPSSPPGASNAGEARNAGHEAKRHRPALAHAKVQSAYAIETRWARTSKRVVDLLVGIPLFAVFAVAYPFVTVILKVTSPGPVLFRQIRIGRGGREVVIYKFRSMHVDAEERLRSDPELYQSYVSNGYKMPSDTDPRITPIGRFLRRSSLDELPQAICLLRGDMSVIGPRPVLPEELVTLHGADPTAYLACKPGLTGLWQVSGRSHVVDDDRAKLDAEYAADWSQRRDLRILLRTIPTVLTAHGAH